MKRRTKKSALPPEGLVAERVAWIDRVVRALDWQPRAPVGMEFECNKLRSMLSTYRDGVVLGSRLAQAQRKLKPAAPAKDPKKKGKSKS